MHQHHHTSHLPAGIAHRLAERCPNGPEPGILIVRDGDRYRLLHGQLRLVASLAVKDALCVEVRGEGLVRILKDGDALMVEQGDRHLPLCRNA